MREIEASLQRFGEFQLEARLMREKAARYCVRWVRWFLTRPASDDPLADQVVGSVRTWKATAGARIGRCVWSSRFCVRGSLFRAPIAYSP